MSEESFIHEVSEELRRDRMRTGWRRYGPYVIGAAILIVVAVAGNEGWSWWQNSNATRSSDEFFSALDQEAAGDIAGAQKSLDAVIGNGSGQYPVLARFKQAGLLAKQGKLDDALTAYDGLATSAGSQQLKNLALLFGANILVDKGDVAGVRSRVQGLQAPTDPLHSVATETLGLVQYKAGDLNGARDTFLSIINDPVAESGVRSRVQLYLQQLEAQGVTVPDAAPAGGETTAGPGAAQTPPAASPPPANDNAGTTPAPATSDATPATDDATPAGIESNQPMTPDPAITLAAPAPAAPAADAGQPALSNGMPAATAPAAPAATPAAPTAPAAPAAPAADATAPTATPTAVPAAPATGTTGQ